MGCVQQAVLEFDEEVRVPWRPRLVPDTGAARATVRHPSRSVPSRVGVCETPTGQGIAVRPASGGARGPVDARPAPVPVRAPGSVPGTAAARGARPAPRRTGRTRVRLTRRARRLAFALALAGGVALGSWLGPLFGDAGQLRLAGESSVVVHSGDTLWSIADSVAGPGDDVRTVVDQIQRLNGLRGTALVPGQSLRLP